LDILDLERGAKVAGYRGYYLKNEGVMVVMGLMMYALSKMIEKGYAPMIPPTLIKGFALFGSGYFKGVEYDSETDEIYQVATRDKEMTGEKSKEQKFLVGTAEPSLLAYYANEVLEENKLPLKMCGFSPCYRSEIGSYGKDTKGMYRVHEFMKVEQIILAPTDVALTDKLQQEMLGISEELHKDLGLPYRKLQICTGDMGAGKYKMFDLEAWLPGLDRWGETGSASNFLDWQARRLNVKYVDKNGEKKFVYMLNNTALATPRTFIAILENYQQKDGSVKVPEVLQKYVGKKIILPK
jgi:seryl-tRNA synthetase